MQTYIGVTVKDHVYNLHPFHLPSVILLMLV